MSRHAKILTAGIYSNISRINPAMILPNGKSRRILFIFDDIKILYDYMFSYFGCQVNELYIIVEVM